MFTAINNVFLAISVSYFPPSVEDVARVEQMIQLCDGASKTATNPYDVLRLLLLERDLGVPDEASGILVASWCHEAGLRLQDRDGGPLRGDWRNGVAMAHGPFQLWPWHRAWCGLAKGGADDLIASATCYWRRIADRYEIRTAGCSDRWRVAEALAANGPRYKHWGCKARSKHWLLLERWRAPILRAVAQKSRATSRSQSLALEHWLDSPQL